MARFLKSNKDHIGLSPDSIQFRGEKKSEGTIIEYIAYNDQNIVEKQITSLDDLFKYELKNGTTWINIYGLHDIVIMQKLSVYLDIDPIIISEILNTHSRTKVIEYEDCLYVSAKMATFNSHNDNRVKTENIVFIVKNAILITFQERKENIFNPVRERLKNPKKRVRQLGSDYLMFALIDIIIDNYAYITSKVGEKVEALDEKLLHVSDESILHEIYAYKSELIYLHKSIFPCKEMIFSLTKMDSEYIDTNNIVFYKELQSNINHAVESLNNYKEILTNQLNIYHTQVSSRLNDIMRFLTVFSAIFIPLTFIAGIYGTNFEFIPELKLRYGYPIMLAVMLFVGIGMIIYFKKKKWI